ncbi:MAG: TonB-dependent receptor plug domain-containing protein [Bacteroidetes bacterium]|nr:TonB-dependent receptor plug domain-containing protein [Bacteroidota bacterium]
MKFIWTYLLLNVVQLLYATGVKDTVTLQDVMKIEKVSAHPEAIESPFTDIRYIKGKRIADALNEYSSVYVKKYGAGQLASLSVRGTSATQTEILWNGVKLNSPALGQVDLSLFQIGMQDDLQLIRTGYHGTIGGTLLMDNQLKMDSGFSISGNFRVASFSTFEVMADAQYAKGIVSGSTRFNFVNATNNFSYRNIFEENHPRTKQTNASVSQLSFLQQFGFRLNENNSLNLYCWLTDAFREISPIMSKPLSNESQKDGSLRLMADWKGRYKNLNLKLSSALLKDDMEYISPNAFLDETSHMTAIRSNFSARYIFPFQLILNSELNYDYEAANVLAYRGKKDRSIVGLKVYADYYFLKQFRIHGGFREDFVGQRFSTFAPELAFSYSKDFKQKHGITAGLIASRNFRFPTLNDLYWIPGGNPELKQEKSWNGEIQLKYRYGKVADVAVSNFYIYVNDWIQWTPNGSFWSPENLKRVFSRGIETNFHFTNAMEHLPNQFVFHLNTSYSYTRTTNLDATSEFDNSKGKQLIYVPVHQVVVGLQLQYRKFYLRAVNRFTDKVYTTTDNSQSLKGYFISDLELGKELNFAHLELGISFRVNNMANSSYQVIAQRPMPGRNFEGTFRFKFL